MPDIAEGLESLGLTIPDYDPPEDALFAPYRISGNRLLVSAVAPYKTDTDIPRLAVDANIEISELDDLPADHPLRQAMIGARLVTIHALSIARAAAGLDRIETCLRAALTLKTGPQFDRAGLVFLPVARIMKSLFGEAPVHSITGVTTLPGGAPMLLETEFVLRGHG